MALMTLSLPDSIPAEYIPNQQLAAEAHEKEKLILRLGEEIAERRFSQRQALEWFAADPERCWALGAANIYELIKNPDIGRALWGAPVNTAASAQRLKRLVDMQMQFGPDEPVDVFDLLPKSVTSTGMLTAIEKEVKALPAPEAPERAQAVADLVTKLETIGQRTWRENNQAAKQVLTKAFTFNTDRGILSFVNSATNVPALKVNLNAPVEVATLLHRLVGVNPSFSLNANEVTAWVEGKPVVVAQVLTNNETALDAISDALRAPRH